MTTRPIAVITGASSGIGEALTHRFANAGHDLVLVARSADKLKALATQLEAEHDIKVLVLPTDLAKPGAAQQLAATLKRRKRMPDVLVNCAGVLEQQHFVRMTPAAHQAIIDLTTSVPSKSHRSPRPARSRAPDSDDRRWQSSPALSRCFL